MLFIVLIQRLKAVCFVYKICLIKLINQDLLRFTYWNPKFGYHPRTRVGSRYRRYDLGSEGGEGGRQSFDGGGVGRFPVGEARLAQDVVQLVRRPR